MSRDARAWSRVMLGVCFFVVYDSRVHVYGFAERIPH